MKIVQLRKLTGPSVWSVEHSKLIVLQLEVPDPGKENIEKFEETVLQSFNGLIIPEQLKAGINNGCGNFRIAIVLKGIITSLLRMAGSPCSYSDCRPSIMKGVFDILFSYEEARAGEYAANIAVDIAFEYLNGNSPGISDRVNEIKKILEEDRPGPSTYSIVQEAEKRQIPCIRLDENAQFQLGYGIHQKRIEATIASTTSSIAVELAGDKQATKNLLAAASIPVPGGGVAKTEEELKSLIDSIGYPMVIKPKDGNQGKGATTNIQSDEDALIAFNAAKEFSEEIICEEYINGFDFRVLVIDYKFVAAAMRIPASVKGDGLHSIQDLVEKINSDPRRGDGHENIMTKIVLDEHAERLLEKYGYDPGTVLPLGEVGYLKTTANLSTGGTATDVTQKVHPKNIDLFNRIARLVGLDICGIDIMAKDLEKPLKEIGAAVIEVNAAPGFRMHLHPSNGKARNVASPVIDMLFPGNNKGLVPIIAVTGTNGKTTTTGLTAHICQQQGLVTGYTSTNGVYIQDDQVMEGDCSGPESALMVLKDPSVEVAVLECARGGILRRGLAFEKCDIAIVTNIAEDHLGLDGIDTLDELAKVKAVLPRSVKTGGYAVLNADDDLVFKMKEMVNCNIALFSLGEGIERIRAHCNTGGLAAVFENGEIVIYEGGNRMVLCHVDEVPVTYNGKAAFNIANVLGSVLAGYIMKFPSYRIIKALQSFMPSPEQTPGRLNIFRFKDHTVLIDYAHNPHGVKALGKFINAFATGKKTGVIAGVGDRRDEDLIALGKEAGLIFDDLVIRMDDDLRGRTVQQIYDLITSGIQISAPGKKVKLIADETEAIRRAITDGEPGSFVTVLVDNVSRAISIASSFREHAKKNNLFLQLPLHESYMAKKAVV